MQKPYSLYAIMIIFSLILTACNSAKNPSSENEKTTETATPSKLKPAEEEKSLFSNKLVLIGAYRDTKANDRYLQIDKNESNLLMVTPAFFADNEIQGDAGHVEIETEFKTEGSGCELKVVSRKGGGGDFAKFKIDSQTKDTICEFCGSIYKKVGTGSKYQK